MKLIYLSRLINEFNRKIVIRAFSLSSFSYQHLPNYYAILGVNKSMTISEIKAAYLKKANKYHPDKNPSKEARYMFQLMAEAYEILSDKTRRKDYDEYGTGDFTYGGTANGPQRPSDHQFYNSEEMYEKIFGDSNKSDPNIKFTDMESNETSGIKEQSITISFKEAALGTEVSLSIVVNSLCYICEGEKSQPGYTWQVCVYCEGTGIETTKAGHVETRRVCSYCHGTKKFIRYPCLTCEGTGQRLTTYQQIFKIPPGTENGQVFKMRISDDIMKYTVSQDPEFYLYVTVLDSNNLKKEGLDLFSKVFLSPVQALLGGKAKINGIYSDNLAVNIPSCYNPNKSICCHGQGIQLSDGQGKGNHYIKCGIQVPPKITKRQKRLWLKFASIEDLNIPGCVDGVETKDSHRYQTNIIEPNEVTNKTLDSYIKEQNSNDSSFKTILKKIWNN